MLALFRKTNSRHPRTEASSAGPRPGTMARGSPRALRCSCQTIRHANVPHGVLKEPSKRRRSLKPQSHKPLKRIVHSGYILLLGFLPRIYHDVSSNVSSKYSNGVSASTAPASHLRKPKLSGEGVANACVRSTTRPKANRLRTTHPDEDVTDVFATTLGRIRAHGGPGQRSPGPPHPPPGWNAEDVGLRGTQTTDKLSYVLVASN